MLPQVLSWIGLTILCINTVLYFKGFARKGKAFKSLSLYLAAILVVQLAMEVYALQNRNNHFISTYYLFLHYILLSFFFYFLFSDVKQNLKLLVRTCGIAVTAGLAVQYVINPQLYYSFNPSGFLVTSSIIILYSVLYLFELITKKMPYTYLISGMLIYFISSSVIFAAATSIVSFGNKVNVLIWNINAALFILYQLLILGEWIQTFYRKVQVREQ